MVGLTNPNSTSGFSFGQPNSSTSTGYAFGQSGPSGAFSFSQPSQTANVASISASSTGFNFGATGPMTVTTTSSVGSFGQTLPVSSVAPSFSLNPGVPATSSGFNFGQATSAPTLNFGLSTQPAATTSAGFSFASGGTFGQPSAGFSFGQTAATTAAPALNFVPGSLSAGSGMFGLQTPTTGQSLFSLGTGLAPTASNAAITAGLFSFTTTNSASSLGLGGNAPAALSYSVSGGLGGFQPTSIEAGPGSAVKAEGKSTKETPLPNEIFASISLFETYKDTEKKASEENIRQTAAPFHKLGEDTKKLKQHIIKLSNQHAQLHSNAKKLKWAVLQEAENVEMARRTRDTPMTLQGDNKAPEQFFLHLVRSFEERMAYCRNKIDEIERCSNANGNLSDVSPEDVTEILRKEHETIKMLASRIYTLHNQLLDLYQKANNPVLPIPEALFKPGLGETERNEISSKNSSVLRPCLGEGGSGLLNFQSGQQRAKAALSLGGAPPPAIPLTQASLLGGFGNCTSGNGLFNLTKSTLGFGCGNGSLLGDSSTQISSSQTFSMFSPSNTSIFGSKPFGKSASEPEESQRKRRM